MKYKNSNNHYHFKCSVMAIAVALLVLCPHSNALESVNKGKEILEDLRNKTPSSINTKYPRYKPLQKPLNQEIAEWTKNLETRLDKDSKEQKKLTTTEASAIQPTKEQEEVAKDIVNQSQDIINKALEIGVNNRDKLNNTSTKDITTSGTDFFIFTSFSMGEKSIQSLIQSAQRYNGVVVMKGFKNGDIKATAAVLLKFIEKTGGGVVIDPILFKEYKIKRVPSYVLTKPCDETLVSSIQVSQSSQCQPQYDILSGNVSPRYALEKISAQGDLREEARRRLEE